MIYFMQSLSCYDNRTHAQSIPTQPQHSAEPWALTLRSVSLVSTTSLRTQPVQPFEQDEGLFETRNEGQIKNDVFLH